MNLDLSMFVDMLYCSIKGIKNNFFSGKSSKPNDSLIKKIKITKLSYLLPMEAKRLRMMRSSSSENSPCLMLGRK